MTASAANGFGQIQSAPTGTSCTEIPYDFHPMYSTSSPQTRVPWSAHSYNIAFDEDRTSKTSLRPPRQLAA